MGGDRHALVLQAALAAFGGGDVQQAEGMALQLAAARHEPAWELAAVVAGHPGVSGVPARQRLLSFALLHAPVERLPMLLEAWEAADVAGGRERACWLRPGIDQPASIHVPPEQQLDRFFETCASSNNKGSTTGNGDSKTLAEAPALLASLLALGIPGLQRWEALLSQHQQRLPYGQRRQALLLGVIASLLLALRPSCMDASSAEAVERQAEVARQLLELSPGELLARWQERSATSAPSLSRKGSVLSGGDGSTTASETASDAGSTDATLRHGHAQHYHEQQQQQLKVVEEATAAAAGEALRRFLSQLVSADDAQRVQQLLPGEADAAAALAASSSDPGSRREVVLKLAAAAAGRPGGGAHAFTSSGGSRQSQRKQSAAAAGNGAGQRKAKDAGGDEIWHSQLDVAKATATLADALQLAQRYSVPAWEVHLAFVQSLLLTRRGPEAQQAVEELLRAAWPALLKERHSSVMALAMLLRAAWPSPNPSGSDVPRLALLLQLATECCASLATADVSQGVAWEAAATLLSSCGAAAAALAAAAPALNVKAFLLPPLLMVSNWASQQLDSDGNAAKQQQQQQALLEGPLPCRAELAQHLLPLLGPGNATELAEAVAQLSEQQEAAREQLAGGQEAGDAYGFAYPLSSSDVFETLACKVLANGEQGSGMSVLVHFACHHSQLRTLF